MSSRRGGDSDLGDPVYVVAYGVVMTSQSFPTWGNVVLPEHSLPSGEKVWSQYADLNDTSVKEGDLVWLGQQIDTIGKGPDNQ